MLVLLFLLSVFQLNIGHPSGRDEVSSDGEGVDAMLIDVSNKLKTMEMKSFKFIVPNPFPHDPKYYIYPCLPHSLGQTVCGPNAVCSVYNSTSASCSCNPGFVHVPHKEKQFNCVLQGEYNDKMDDNMVVGFHELLKDIEETMSSLDLAATTRRQKRGSDYYDDYYHWKKMFDNINEDLNILYGRLPKPQPELDGNCTNTPAKASQCEPWRYEIKAIIDLCRTKHDIKTIEKRLYDGVAISTCFRKMKGCYDCICDISDKFEMGWGNTWMENGKCKISQVYQYY